jgi:two-component system NtrC family sensor kinase
MRLVHKIALLLLAAALIPLGTAGFLSIARNQRALEGAVRDTLDHTAAHAAAVIAADIEGRARQLAQTASMIEWDRLDGRELAGAMALIKKQVKADDAAVTLPAAPPAPAWVAHAAIARAEREGRNAVVYSEPFAVDGKIMLAASTATGTRVLSLLIPLAPLSRALEEVRGAEPLALALVDGSGRGVVTTRAAPALDATLVADAVAGKDGHARRSADGDVIAAFAPVGGLGWSVVVAEPAAIAFAVPRALRRQTLLVTAAAALGALLLALWFARRLTAALERLSGAARALGEGKLDTRVSLASDDEVGTLAKTFNHMGEELAASRAEIERWNRELEQRVVERTQQLKEAQAQLVQAQKLAALGQLGAGVAHEINNPLGGVIGHVQLLLAERTPDADDYTSLKHIEEGARRASEIVQNLLRFSVQRKEPVRTSVDLNKLVKDTLSLTETLIKDQKIALALDLDGKKPRARADSGQLAQVLLNLAANARTAMPSGGSLRVSTLVRDGQVGFSVADTGKGIAPEIKERIFEPFFTTKDEWSNVGLGLSVSYRIVEEHGGKIEVDSAVGRGSTFTVWLPSS